MLKSSLCDYSDACILVKGTITVNNTAAAAADAANNTNKKVIFKNFAPFTICISEINNTQVDNPKDINIVMPMCNLIEHIDNYSKTSVCSKVCDNIVKICLQQIIIMKLLVLLTAILLIHLILM